MNDLIEQLEKATGPDRELDALVYCAVQQWIVHPEHGFPIEIWAEKDCIFWKGGTVTQGPLFLNGFGFPPYTTSIDAALTLVPVDFDYEVSINGTADDKTWTCTGIRWWREGRERNAAGWMHRSGNAKTTALSICIAALKVRSLTQGQQSGDPK